jgi:GNAT superfamily N-acetyltransferase
MSDMLVKLYALPEVEPLRADLSQRGIVIRQARTAERGIITDWVRQRFSAAVTAECQAAIDQRPVSCYIAVESPLGTSQQARSDDSLSDALLGFACFDVAARGVFGPEGVREDRRGEGIGKMLLLSCLHEMKAERYAYAVIGWAGPTEFYAKAVGATLIEGSEARHAPRASKP